MHARTQAPTHAHTYTHIHTHTHTHTYIYIYECVCVCVCVCVCAVASRCFPHSTFSLASEQTLKDLKRSQGHQRGDEESGFG